MTHADLPGEAVYKACQLAVKSLKEELEAVTKQYRSTPSDYGGMEERDRLNNKGIELGQTMLRIEQLGSLALAAQETTITISLEDFALIRRSYGAK